jgi:lipopolysaccharide transport system permease protein
MSTTDHPPQAFGHLGATDLAANDVDDDSGPGSIVTVIRPRTGWIEVNWDELVQSHELFFTLIARDLKIRYKQTVLGVAWAVLQPLATMIVFSVIFGRMVGIDTGTIPYPVFVLVGLVPWTFFSIALNNASLSLLQHQNLLTKIYFPRLYVPAAAVGSALVDMGIGMGLFLFIMPLYGQYPGWGILALPLMVLMVFAATLGLGLTMAAVTILYRDLRFVMPFAIQLAMYVSPVSYRIDRIPRPLQFVAALNPMYGVINGFRSSLLGDSWDLPTLAVSVLSTLAILTFGLFFFRKTERLISDIV